MSDKTFEPKIVAFCCHYCAYASADLAGSMRLQYPPGVRIIRTPCTGRLEVEYYLKALENGADGVLIAGCLEGGCHFIDGNLFARKRVNAIRTLLEESGMDKERLRMVNVSAAMAKNLVEVIFEMTDIIKKIGPTPISINPPSSRKTGTSADENVELKSQQISVK
jgi:F420-non-reducing hydrogenase iron-sulfur subunit